MTRKNGPAISIVMPVRNALPFLDEAVESILGQTRNDFEFVIFDDASTDGSAKRLCDWALRDSRIKLIQGERTLGPAKSSNEVVRHASAPLIARMDADDVSYPDRLERQSEILARCPDVGIVASLCDVIDSTGRLIREPELWRLFRSSWFSPFPHGSMMFRRNLFDSLGGYREECEFWEDLDLVIRASERTRIMVFPRPLYAYRQSSTGTRLASDQGRVESAIDLRYRSMDRIRENRGYDDLLRSARHAANERIDPRVFISLGLLKLWADQRPSSMKRLLSRGRLRFDFATIVAIAWSAWVSVSPKTMRAFIRFLSRIRNSVHSPKAILDEPLEWLTPAKRNSAQTRKHEPGE